MHCRLLWGLSVVPLAHSPTLAAVVFTLDVSGFRADQQKTALPVSMSAATGIQALHLCFPALRSACPLTGRVQQRLPDAADPSVTLHRALPACQAASADRRHVAAFVAAVPMAAAADAAITAATSVAR